MHPSQILFTDGAPLPVLPVCEHFAGNEKFITRAFTQQRETAVNQRPVFDVICDLEDGAAAGEEAETAKMVAGCASSADNTFNRVGVRIHDATHPHWMKDIDIIVKGAGARLAYITLPKCDSRMDALKVASYINHVADEAGLKHIIPLHVMIETHGGLAEVQEIAELRQVEGVTLGTMDFVSSHQGALPASCMSSPGQIDHPLLRRAKLEIAAAALGNGAVPIQGITQEYKDLAVVENDARRARAEFGCLRMYSIHPDQIAAIVRGLTPSAQEIEDACAILLSAAAKGWGPVGHQGKLHDRASYRYFWQLIKRAHAIGVGLPVEAINAFFSRTAK